MEQFLKRLIYFTLAGFILIISFLSIYLYFDPFKVLRTYKDYSFSHVLPNRDYVSTTMFLRNYKDYHYNSFIFGSSRTIAFKPSTWRKYLSGDSFPFMFDASSESIYGIYTKLRFLDSLKIELKNVLIILCRDQSFRHSENHEGHLFIKHPLTSGESSLKFQFTFFQAFLSPDFLFRFLAYQIIGEYRPFMAGCIEHRKISCDTITNETHIIDQENELAQNSTEYYLKYKNKFYERKGEKVDSIQRINDIQLFMLKEVKRILVKNETNYKIILSPLYEQIRFSNYDINILKTLFGDNIYDFTGENEFTKSITNFYEPSHYRPSVGDSIFKFIYK